MRNKLTQKIFHIAKTNNFNLQITWLEGRLNGRADSLSRKLILNPRVEWSIPKNALEQVLKVLTWKLDMDLFASHLNNKFSCFCSRTTDPHCFRVDAFTVNWKPYKCYCFCPFRLIGKALRKIETDQVEFTAMIVPFHPSSAWFPKFMSLCRELLYLLPPRFAKQLYLPWDSKIQHPLAHNMRLLLGNLCSSSYNPMVSKIGQLITLQTMDGKLVQATDILQAPEGGCSTAKRRRLKRW